ncbi:MAG TPA: radical SAM protein, partial [Candidatus Nanoarchaeia archaeon]|nr:radical SAM protein [Candidatus Nanoarchaeia archaeon]
IEDLDSLPFPAYQLFPPFSKYSPNFNAGGRCSGIIMSSRGCTFSCPFCYCPDFWGKKYRVRSPSSVVDEMEYLRDEFGVEFIDFSDDTFTLDMVRAERICDEIIKRKVGLNFSILTRVDTVNKNLLRKLADAGCEKIQYGVETASSRLLKSTEKGITVEGIEKALKLTREARIETIVNLIHGLPGETVSDIELTFQFLKRNRENIDQLHSTIAVILPGTALHERGKRLGLIDDEVWFSYNSNHPLLSLDPSLRRLPPYLENFKLEELIRFLRLTNILFHSRKRQYKLTMQAIMGYAWNYWMSPGKYLDLIKCL